MFSLFFPKVTSHRLVWRQQFFTTSEVLLSASEDDKIKLQIFQGKKKVLLCPYPDVNSEA